ncbi:thiosulfate reductase cytochrome b subunit [Rhizomicrobium palustre]|uniref:Thiosulfate reductase cytochrome b subunit n=1 Tax=Rhizomicrobium palustre TaxID=189966 RepID=A0A846MW88_9PROT|nr:cytochrome b/b6 domain-containing protein [Rhizomicrobium palustre]NIK87421.1 thiosulfate reductase cytochrome b subunit [Rhizomicrobium palustre]
MLRKVLIHPLPLRIWHWTNALGMILLALTGIQIRYVDLINIVSYKNAVMIHNYTGFVVIANFFVWLAFHLITAESRNYHAELNPVKMFKGCLNQLVYYGYGMFQGWKNPFHIAKYKKFNPLQGLTYQIVMFVFVPLQILTGLMLWDVTRFSKIVDFLGGVRVVDTVHVIIFTIIACYIPFHAYLATLGRTPGEHIHAMITGYEEVEEEDEEKKAE